LAREQITSKGKIGAMRATRTLSISLRKALIVGASTITVILAAALAWLLRSTGGLPLTMLA
jgi:hypothetical protein